MDHCCSTKCFYTSYTRYFGFGIILRLIGARCQLKQAFQQQWITKKGRNEIYKHFPLADGLSVLV